VNLRANNACLHRTVLQAFLLPETDPTTLQQLESRTPCSQRQVHQMHVCNVHLLQLLSQLLSLQAVNQMT